MNRRTMASAAFWIVLVHFILNLAHGWAHEDKTVPVTFAMYLFIIPVILIGPIVAYVLIHRRFERSGYTLLAVTLIGSFFFGLAYHFMIEGPDHVSHVQGGPGAAVFFWTSLALAIIEALGGGLGVWGMVRSLSTRSGGALDMTA